MRKDHKNAFTADKNDIETLRNGQISLRRNTHAQKIVNTSIDVCNQKVEGIYGTCIPETIVIIIDAANIPKVNTNAETILIRVDMITS